MNENKNTRQYPEGHFVGIWMAIGMAVFSGMGVPLSIALGNPGMIAIGPGIGVAFGLAIGQSVEKRKAAEGLIRPLTEAESRRKKRLLMWGVVILALGVLLGVVAFLRH